MNWTIMTTVFQDLHLLNPVVSESFVSHMALARSYLPVYLPLLSIWPFVPHALSLFAEECWKMSPQRAALL